jgi:hypothetical protein
MTGERPEFLTAHTLFDVPEVQPGQFLVSPLDNKLIEPPTLPIPNFSNPPEWFTSLDRTERRFRGCQGTQDYLRNGITFRLPADVEMRPSRDGKDWEARYAVGGPANLFRVESFDHETVGPTAPIANLRKMPESRYVKIVNPWRVKTAPGWSSLLISPFWERQTRDWELIPGVVNTDYYHSAHWVMAIFTDEPFVIPYGTPIAHMITFPRVKNDRVIYGDDKIARLLDERGFGGPFPPSNKDRGYRVQQGLAGSAKCPYPASHDDMVPDEPKKKPFWRKRSKR